MGVATTVFDQNDKVDCSGASATTTSAWATLIFSANDPDIVLGVNGDNVTVAFGNSDTVQILLSDLYKYSRGVM